MGNNPEDENFLKAKITFQEKEKCEKLGMEINEEDMIEIYMGDINAMMIKDDSPNLFIFLHGMDLEIYVENRKAIKEQWKKLKDANAL